MEASAKRCSFLKITYLWLTLFFVLVMLFLINANSGFYNVFRADAPDGQFLYLLSKTLGLTALFLLWWQLFSTLLSSTGLLNKARLTIIKAGKTTHIVFGSLLAIMIISHAGLFISAVSLRQDLLAIHLLVPDFSGYYHLGLSFGVIALFVILLGVALAAVRRHLHVLWGYAHRLVLPGFALAALHAVMIGSEAGSGIILFLLVFFVLSLALICAVYVWRMYTSPQLLRD